MTENVNMVDAPVSVEQTAAVENGVNTQDAPTQESPKPTLAQNTERAIKLIAKGKKYEDLDADEKELVDLKVKEFELAQKITDRKAADKERLAKEAAEKKAADEKAAAEKAAADAEQTKLANAALDKAMVKWNKAKAALDEAQVLVDAAKAMFPVKEEVAKTVKRGGGARKGQKTIIGVIANAIESAGADGILRDDILPILVTEFPERDEKNLKGLLQAHVPFLINKEKFPLVKLENGRFAKK